MPWSDSILATIRVQLNNFAERGRLVKSGPSSGGSRSLLLINRLGSDRSRLSYWWWGFAFALANPVICACA